MNLGRLGSVDQPEQAPEILSQGHDTRSAKNRTIGSSPTVDRVKVSFSFLSGWHFRVMHRLNERINKVDDWYSTEIPFFHCEWTLIIDLQGCPPYCSENKLKV
jgi:hypothetical protein